MEFDYINNLMGVEFNKAAYCHAWTVPELQQPTPIKFKTGTTVFYPTNQTSSYDKKIATWDHSPSSQHLRSSAPEFKPKSIKAGELNIKEKGDKMFQNMSQLEQDLIKQLSYLITENEQLKLEKAIWISEREDEEIKMQWLRNIIDKYKEKECVLKKENKDLLAKLAQDKCDESQWAQPANNLCDSNPAKSFVPGVTIKSSEKGQHNDLLCTLRTEKLEAEKLGWISERENIEIKIQWLRNIIAKYKEKESVVKKENDDLLAEMEKLKQEKAMPEKRDELLRAQSANNFCEQSKERESKSTAMIAHSSESSEKDNNNDSICTAKNRGIKILRSFQNCASKLDNAKDLVEDSRGTAIMTNHFNDEHNTSIQSSIMSSMKLGDDATPMFTSSMLNESFDSHCCQKLKKQNEILKQIVKSQKERRQEREIRIKDLNVTLKSLKSYT